MTTTTRPTGTTETAAVAALIGLLPSAAPITAEPAAPGTWAGHTATAVTASFVGASSADVAVVLDGAEAVAQDAGIESTLVSIVDVLRPALESATAVLGAGVLGDARVDDASALFSDEETTVFELLRRGEPAGWFGIRIRPSAADAVTASSTRSVIDKLGRISSVEMALTVEIGRTRMSVRDLLSLEPGGIVELDRSAGSPADVLLNGRLIARGEIVVIDQDYAVRITSILDVAEGLL